MGIDMVRRYPRPKLPESGAPLLARRGYWGSLATVLEFLNRREKETPPGILAQWCTTCSGREATITAGSTHGVQQGGAMKPLRRSMPADANR